MKKFFYLMGFHWLSCLLAIVFFVIRFGYPYKIIIIHMTYITFLLSVLAIIAAFANKAFSRNIGIIINIVIFYSFYAFFCFVYIANFVSNSYWRENLYLQLITDYMFSASKLEIFMSIYFWVGVTFFCIIFETYRRLSFILYNTINEFFLSEKKYSSLKISQGFVNFLLVICVATISLFFMIFNFDFAEEFTINEPLVSFFFEPEKHSPTIEQAIYEQNIRYSYPKNISFNKKNVIIIIVDALRSDHTSLYGYHRPTTPFLQSLYDNKKIKKVEVGLSHFVASTGGILATLSSRHYLDIHYANFKLHNLLKDQGYTTNFILTGLHNWYGLRKFYNLNDIDFYIDGTQGEKYFVNDDRNILEALKKLPAYSNKPNFFYFHLMSAHMLGLHRKEFEIYNDSQNNKINFYDNGIIQADYYIKEIFKMLEDKGYLQNSIAIILADHGELLGEKGLYGHGTYLYQPCLQIPILIYDTDNINYRNLEFATQLDIAPTVVDRLGLPIPKSWKGYSLVSQKARDYSLHETFTSREQYSVIIRKNAKIYKYIFFAKELKEELYELSDDPYENKNILQSCEPQFVDEFREKCRLLISERK